MRKLMRLTIWLIVGLVVITGVRMNIGGSSSCDENATCPSPGSMPTVDGRLCNSSEYTNYVPGTWSRLYYKWVSGTGFYLLNDWNGEFDPSTPNDSFNIFWFRNGSYDYRFKVHATSVEAEYKSVSACNWSPYTSTSDWAARMGYHKTCLKTDVKHAIWEFKIGSTAISGAGSVVGADVKNGGGGPPWGGGTPASPTPPPC